MAGMPMDNGILQSVDPLPNIGITPVFLKIIPSARFCSSVIFFLSTCPIEGLSPIISISTLASSRSVYLSIIADISLSISSSPIILSERYS